MPPLYTLYTPEASFRAFATLIAAEYNGISIEVSTDASAASKSPVGKLPVLECKDGAGDDSNNSRSTVIIFSSHAAARYVAGLRRDCGLMGRSAAESAAIDAWMDWCATDVELPACVWFYPVAGYMPFHQASYEKAKTDLGNALAKLNAHLAEHKYLAATTTKISLADIVVASTLLYPFKLVCDPNYLKPYPHVVRWFQACVGAPEFQQVVGTVTLCQKELKAAAAPET